MTTATRRTYPLAVTQPQMAVHRSARGTGLARRVPTTDPYQIDSLPTALVLKKRIEHSKTCICQTVCKVMVPEHTLHIQVLDAYGTHLIVVRQMVSDLVNIVKTPVGNLCVDTGYMMLDLLPTQRTFGLVPQFPLVMLQAFLGHPRKMGRNKLAAIGTDGKCLYSGIYSNRSFGNNVTARFFADCRINEYGSIVFPVGIHGNRHILYSTKETAMQNNRNILALWNTERPVLPVNRTVLWIVKRLTILLAFRKRMLGHVTPPVLESISHLFDRILQGLGIDLIQPGINLFQRYKLFLSSETADTDSRTAPHHGHIIERSVIYNTKTAETLREVFSLFRCRIKTVFVRPQHDANILILCLNTKLKKHENEQISRISALNVQCGISHCVFHKIPLQLVAVPDHRKIEAHLPARNIRTWNHYPGNGSNVGPCTSVHNRSPDYGHSTNCLSPERIFLISDAKAIRISTEISITVDEILLRGDNRTHLGKYRGEIYRKSKIKSPFISRLKHGRIPGLIS